MVYAAICSQESLAAGEPLAASAPRAVRWLVVEYRGAWPRDPLEGGLPDAVLERLRSVLDGLGGAKLLYVRRPELRGDAPYRVFLADCTDGRPSLRAFEVRSYGELLSFDPAAVPGDEARCPLAVVCTHGKRDPCCARYGPPVYEALRRGPLGDAVWQSSHLGGHRFAANLVLLPEGLMFGRVSPEAAPAIAERYLRGEIVLEHYRGRCSHPPAVQAAERALRERDGVLGIGDLELLSAESHGVGTRVRFRIRPSGAERELEVEEEDGPAQPLSCGGAPEPTRRFSVRY